MSVSSEQHSDRQLALRLDQNTATIAYVGDAAIASSTAAPVWRIKRLDTTSGIIIQWADGNQHFDNVWDNRASLTYI